MATYDRFTKFVQAITPSKQELEEANLRFNSVATRLHNEYYIPLYTKRTSMVIGSYGKGTQISPPRDIDMLFLMPDSYFDIYSKSPWNGQSVLLQSVKKKLEGRYPTTDIRGDGQVVVVPFLNGHKVEVLPAWLNQAGKFIVPNTHNGGQWNIVDHNAEINNVDSSDRASNGNTRHLIKMLKTWQLHKNVKIKSLALELNAVHFMAQWPYAGKGATYYDYMARDFFSYLLRYVNGSSLIPGTGTERCFYKDDWFAAASYALRVSTRACEYEANKEDIRAAAEWQFIFGSRYPF